VRRAAPPDQCSVESAGLRATSRPRQKEKNLDMNFRDRFGLIVRPGAELDNSRTREALCTPAGRHLHDGRGTGPTLSCEMKKRQVGQTGETLRTNYTQHPVNRNVYGCGRSVRAGCRSGHGGVRSSRPAAWRSTVDMEWRGDIQSAFAKSTLAHSLGAARHSSKQPCVAPV